MNAPSDSEASARRLRAWPRGTPGVASLALFALVAASLLFGTFLIFATVRAARAEREQVAQTTAVIDALRDIGMAAVNAETGQRGYLITLDRRYLASYQMGAAAYPAALRRLNRALGEGAGEARRALARRAETLADAKFSEMAESVSLVDDGLILDARARLLSDEGQDLMVELRATLRELEQRETAALARASRSSAQAEARMLPLLGWLVLLIVLALTLGLWLVGRTVRAEAAAANAVALAEARDRADLLAKELNHRVKNLFAVVLAIVKMSGRDDPAAKPVVAKIAERIEALVRSHEVTQGAPGGQTVDLADLVDTALAPYRGDDGRCVLAGESIALPARVAVPLGLVLHELVTNAVKYGALAQAGGTLTVSWRRHDGKVRFDWREVVAAPVATSAKEGFGTRLMSSSARQLDGTIERTFHPDGMAVGIVFPA